MRSALVALAAFEITIRRRSATLAGAEPVGIHGEAHGAARLAPVEAGSEKDLVKPFGLGLLLHQAGTGHDHGRDAGVDCPAVRDARSLAQVLDTRIGARA